MLEMDVPQWYILNIQHGYESIVEQEIRELINSDLYKDLVLDVSVPREITYVERNGKKKTVEKPKYPNYFFVKMIYTKQSWWAVKSTRGTRGFCADAKNIPIPMSADEVKKAQLEEVKIEDLKIKVGDNVSILSGPFKDWEGEVIDIRPDDQKIKVNIVIYGRETSMDLDFAQVEKI